MTDVQTTAGATRAVKRATLPETIVSYLLSSEPEKIARVDASELTGDRATWERPEELAQSLSSILAKEGSLWRLRHVQDAWLRLLILGNRVGEVYACGFLDVPVRTAYLVVTPDGLSFHPPLSSEALETARSAHGTLDAAHVAAMDDELPVIDYLIGNIASMLDMGTEAKGHLRALRLARWELDVRSLTPAERAERITGMLARLTAIAKTTIFPIEDLLMDARLKLVDN